MNNVSFSWDERKAVQNARKHQVFFEEAMSVFLDENAVEFFDPDHSEKEDRFLLLGMSWRLRLLAVHYTVREQGRRIRIISARKATKNEARAYSWTRL
jgi:uncharacterized DUF497 family protein